MNVGDRTSVQCVVTTGDLPLVFTWLKDDLIIKSVLIPNGGVSSSSSGGVSGDSFNSYYANATSMNTNHMNYLNDHQITIRQNDEFTSALSIMSITKSQSGVYTCRVQNDAATINHSAQLKVNGKLF